VGKSYLYELAVNELIIDGTAQPLAGHPQLDTISTSSSNETRTSIFPTISFRTS
jgi:hypothetical protein